MVFLERSLVLLLCGSQSFFPLRFYNPSPWARKLGFLLRAFLKGEREKKSLPLFSKQLNLLQKWWFY